MTRMLVVLLALLPISASAADEQRISFLEQEVRNLQRQVQSLSRQIDELRTRPDRSRNTSGRGAQRRACRRPGPMGRCRALGDRFVLAWPSWK